MLLDADLAILEANELAYRIYADQIRQEYAWVPEQEYRMGRRRVLQSFLDRPRIYYVLSHLEVTARRYLATEIAQGEEVVASACAARIAPLSPPH